MNQTIIQLEYDEAVQKLYTRHDGGEDPPKGVLQAALYPDYADIQDKEAAALLVSLDIYRGIPEDGGFLFGGARLLSRSAFDRMLMAACGACKKDVFAIPRCEEPITVNEAKNLVAGKLGSADSRPLDCFAGTEYLNRETASELIAAALNCSNGSGDLPWLLFVPESRTLTTLTLPQRTAVAGPDGCLVTLTVDGVFQPLTGGYTYSGNLKLTVTQRYELYRYYGPKGREKVLGKNWWNNWLQPYRCALFLENGREIPERSITAALVRDGSGFHIASDSSPTNRYGANDFNGIIVSGAGQDSPYEIRDLTVRFTGNSRNDFQGIGAGVLLVGDNTETVIDHADICNYGTVRSALVAGGSARVLVKHSRLQTHDGAFEEEFRTGRDTVTGEMRMAPRQGGFEGNCRCTNLLDQAVTTYYDSQILAEKWGVLSTDINQGVRSVIVNSLVAITGGLNPHVDTSSEAAARTALAGLPFCRIYGSIDRDLGSGPYDSSHHPAGYGTYSIGNSTVKFAGATVVSADYSAVCANDAASVVYCASTQENLAGEYGGLSVEPQNTVVYCRKTGLQLHRGNGLGLAEIRDGTVFHCGALCVAIKSSGAENFYADRSTLVSEMGVVLQMMDEDDVDSAGYHAPEPPTAEDRAAARALIAEGLVDVYTVRRAWDSTARFSNMTVNGDTYNSCGYTGRITPTDIEGAANAVNPFPGPTRMGGSRFHCENARNLGVTLENCIYNGAISTAEAWHFDEETGEVLTFVPREKWYNLCVVRSEPKPAYQAGLILHLRQGSQWNVPRTCYLSSLTVDSSSVIHGRVFVDGRAVQVEPGVTYAGDIRVEPGC